MKYLTENNMMDFLNSLGSSDLQSFINVLDAYLENCFCRTIEHFGMNINDGNVFLELDNGICLASCFGQTVDYIVLDEDGDDLIFPNYIDAVTYRDNN